MKSAGVSKLMSISPDSKALTVALEVGAVVDELDAIEQRFAAPPLAVLAPLDDRLRPTS